MGLNIVALSIVKALGLGYPAVQMVFLRASVGLGLMLPWIVMRRDAFARLDRLGLHGLRVCFSTLALTCSFFAIARLPFALFTVIGFTRPIMTMLLAVVILREAVPQRRWFAAALAFVGVAIAIQPGNVAWSWGLIAAFLTVLFGTSAVILTRHLAGTPLVVMMAFYTGGLTLLTAPFALSSWTPIAPENLWPLLAIGAFAQCAQFCFLQAHRRGQAGFLSVLGYLSLILSGAVGYAVFDEVPTVMFMLGAGLIVAAALWTTLTAR